MPGTCVCAHMTTAGDSGSIILVDDNEPLCLLTEVHARLYAAPYAPSAGDVAVPVGLPGRTWYYRGLHSETRCLALAPQLTALNTELRRRVGRAGVAPELGLCKTSLPMAIPVHVYKSDGTNPSSPGDLF